MITALASLIHLSISNVSHTLLMNISDGSSWIVCVCVSDLYKQWEIHIVLPAGVDMAINCQGTCALTNFSPIRMAGQIKAKIDCFFWLQNKVAARSQKSHYLKWFAHLLLQPQAAPGGNSVWWEPCPSSITSYWSSAKNNQHKHVPQHWQPSPKCGQWITYNLITLN